MHIPPSLLPVTEGAGETFRVAPSFTSQEGFTSTGLHAEFFTIPTCLTLRVSSKLHFETLHHLFPARPRPLLVSVPAIPNKPTSRWVLDARSRVGMDERDQPRLWARRDMHQGHEKGHARGGVEKFGIRQTQYSIGSPIFPPAHFANCHTLPRVSSPSRKLLPHQGIWDWRR